jgi:RNA polymerase sigma-70 factor (ECF subfamily)
MQARAESPDSQLVGAVADGDTGALRTLYERHSRWLSVRLMRRCHDRELVAEVLQDTFVAVWRGAGSYRGDGDVGAWLWGVAVRRLVSRLRRHDLRSEVPVEWADETLDVSAEELVLAGVEYSELGVALASLSPEMRAVVQATILDGLTPSEAAILLGVSRNTVKSRLQRAKRHLRRELVEGMP